MYHMKVVLKRGHPMMTLENCPKLSII